MLKPRVQIYMVDSITYFLTVKEDKKWYSNSYLWLNVIFIIWVKKMIL
jgi:hypothetical protein